MSREPCVKCYNKIDSIVTYRILVHAVNRNHFKLCYAFALKHSLSRFPPFYYARSTMNNKTPLRKNTQIRIFKKRSRILNKKEEEKTRRRRKKGLGWGWGREKKHTETEKKKGDTLEIS